MKNHANIEHVLDFLCCEFMPLHFQTLVHVYLVHELSAWLKIWLPVLPKRGKGMLSSAIRFAEKKKST